MGGRLTATINSVTTISICARLLHMISPLPCCSKDALVKMWDVKGGAAVATLHGHKGSLSTVAWNDNGNWLLTAARDATCKVICCCNES